MASGHRMQQLNKDIERMAATIDSLLTENYELKQTVQALIENQKYEKAGRNSGSIISQHDQ